MPKDASKPRHTTVYFRQAEFDLISQEAERAGTSFSAVVRDCVASQLGEADDQSE